MVDPPDSCRLIQFIDGSIDRTAGRLELQWRFVGLVEDRALYVRLNFEVLYGCPFEIVLGQDLIDATNAFTQHWAAFLKVESNGPLRLNPILWTLPTRMSKVASKVKRKKNNSQVAQALTFVNAVDIDLDQELEVRAQAEYKIAGANTDSPLRQARLEEVNRRQAWETNRTSTLARQTSLPPAPSASLSAPSVDS